MFICKTCGKEHDGTYGTGKYCSLSCKNKRDGLKISNTLKETKNKYRLLNPYKFLIKDFNCICNICNNEYIVHTTQENFDNNNYRKTCSSKCSHTRKHSIETKNKISESLHNTLKKEYICCNCGKMYYINDNLFPNSTKKFCSNECSKQYKITHNGYLSDLGRHKLQETAKYTCTELQNIKRSKNEIYFCELCEEYFSNVEHNKPIFNGWDADIIIHDIKYAVLWNGKWHYEKITEHHSVEQVQNRDKIKIKEIQNYGYTPYIIKDMGKYNPNFVEEQFNIFLKNI